MPSREDEINYAALVLAGYVFERRRLSAWQVPSDLSQHPASLHNWYWRKPSGDVSGSSSGYAWQGEFTRRADAVRDAHEHATKSTKSAPLQRSYRHAV